MKTHPIIFSTPMVQAILEGRKTMTRRVLKVKGCKPFIPDAGFDEKIIEKWNKNYHPYGQPGDVLWVRESFVPDYFGVNGHGYKTDFKESYLEYIPRPKCKPSIHMPKSACRIFLEVTSIRVERLQDITIEDCINEGSPFINSENYHFTWFENIWTKINGQDSWNSNPWVWVIGFKRIDKPENF